MRKSIYAVKICNLSHVNLKKGEKGKKIQYIIKQLSGGKRKR